MRASLVLGGVAAVAISTLGAGVGTPVAQAASCDDGHVCFWTDYNYGGDKVSRGENYCAPNWDYQGSAGEYMCRITNDTDSNFFSIKNRFGDRKVTVDNNAPIGQDWHCIGPGGNRDVLESDGVKYFRIHPLGSRC